MTVAIPRLLTQLPDAPAVGHAVTAPGVRSILAGRAASARRRLLLAAIVATVAIVGFATYDALDAWAIIGPIRLTRLAGLVTVAIALSVSTVVFQTVTRNRILSPSVMGFDAMFSLIVTASVFFLTSAVVNKISPTIMFLAQAAMMTGMAVALFTVLLRKGQTNVHLLVLVGIVMGTFLRSLTSMMASIMDPNEFLNVADKNMATFSVINTPALLIAAVVTIVMLGVIWWRSPTWELLGMGHDLAVALGVRYRTEVKLALAASSVLVAAATALVGPLLFFGLLIANMTVYAIGSGKLRHLIIGSAAIGTAVLVGGQGILEHVLNQATVLPVVIELVGGALLLVLIVRQARS